MTVADIIQIGLLAVTALAALAAMIQISSNTYWNRLRMSHETLVLLVEGPYQDTLDQIARTASWDLIEDGRTYEDLARQLGPCRELQQLDRDLRRMLQLLEALLTSVEAGIVHENVCRNYMFSIVTTVYGKCTAFVDEQRRIRAEPRVFEHVEKYARKWRSR